MCPALFCYISSFAQTFGFLVLHSGQSSCVLPYTMAPKVHAWSAAQLQGMKAIQKAKHAPINAMKKVIKAIKEKPAKKAMKAMKKAMEAMEKFMEEMAPYMRDHEDDNDDDEDDDDTDDSGSSSSEGPAMCWAPPHPEDVARGTIDYGYMSSTREDKY